MLGLELTNEPSLDSFCEGVLVNFKEFSSVSSLVAFTAFVRHGRDRVGVS